MLAVVDIIHGLIIGEIRRQFEETTQTGAGGRSLKVGSAEDAKNECRNIIEAAVLTDTVVDINGTDALGNSVADVVPAADRICFHSGLEVGECVRLVGFSHLPCSRVIRYFGQSAAALFQLPDTE